MSRTIRKGKHTNARRDGYKRFENDTWCDHDLPEIRRELNNTFREEEKQYFNKFKEVKYNQKPKSRGWKSH